MKGASLMKKKTLVRGFILSIAVAGILLFILLATTTPCLALKPGEASFAAEMAAGMRAVSSMDPDETFRNPDVYALDFLPENFWFFGPLVKDYAKSKAFLTYYRNTSYYTVNACTKHIDSIVTATALKDIKQIVLIGAGLDSRPYRFSQQMPGIRFFEIDLPDTQVLKKSKVIKVFGSLPAYVTYIPFDYRTKNAFSPLQQAGFNTQLKTLFILDGVSRFMEREVVEGTLRSIVQNSSPGSEIIMDYLFDAVVQGDFNIHRGAGYGSLRMKAAGEPWRYGIPEGQSERFCSERGLTLLSDLSPKDLTRKYLVRSDGTIDGEPSSYVRIIHAAIKLK